MRARKYNLKVDVQLRESILSETPIFLAPVRFLLGTLSRAYFCKTFFELDRSHLVLGFTRFFEVMKNEQKRARGNCVQLLGDFAKRERCAPRTVACRFVQS